MFDRILNMIHIGWSQTWLISTFWMQTGHLGVWKATKKERGVLLLTKITLLHGYFFTFFKLYTWYQIMQSISIYPPKFWKSLRLEDKSRRQFQRYPWSLRRRPYKNNVGECILVFLSKTFRYFSAFLISLLQWNITLKVFNQLDQVVSLQ